MSYFGTGTKSGILTNLYNKINAISGIKFVDWQRRYDSGITPDRCPGCYINDVREDKTKLLSNIVQNLFTVAVIAWVWAAQGENLGSKLNAFIDSVKEAIMSDQSQSNNAYSTIIQIVETDAGTRHPQGLGIIMLQIVYYSEK